MLELCVDFSPLSFLSHCLSLSFSLSSTHLVFSASFCLVCLVVVVFLSTTCFFRSFVLSIQRPDNNSLFFFSFVALSYLLPILSSFSLRCFWHSLFELLSCLAGSSTLSTVAVSIGTSIFASIGAPLSFATHALSVSGSASLSLSITLAQFTHNFLSDGNIVTDVYLNDVFVSDTNFTDNACEDSCAMDLRGHGTAEIVRCVFANNVAVNYSATTSPLGSAVTAALPEVYITASTFEGGSTG